MRKVSLADPRLNTPVRLKEEYPPDHHMRERAKKRLLFLKSVVVTEVFDEILTANTQRVMSLNSLPPPIPKINIACSDAKCLSFEFSARNGKEPSFPSESVQLIITSPPYPGSQKYIRCSSLSLGWLGLCNSNKLRALKSQVIGREEFIKSECSSPVKTGIEER